MFDKHARGTTASKRTVSDVCVKKQVIVLSVVVKPRLRRTVAETAEAVSSVFESASDSPGPAVMLQSMGIKLSRRTRSGT